MSGFILIFAIILISGLIAFVGDWMGLKVGKKRVSILGLRPHYTAVFITVITGILIAVITITILTIFSADVRTALFGMEELKEELSFLSQEVETRNLQLSTMRDDLQQKVAQLQEVEEKYQKLSQEIEEKTIQLNELIATRQQLMEEKEKLTKEVEELNATIRALYAGITWIREGEVIFGSDEQIALTIIQGGKPAEKIREELIKFLNEASDKALALGASKYEQTEQVFIIAQRDFDEVVEKISNSESSKEWVVRLLSSLNVVKGEPIVAYFTLTENRLIFRQGEVIVSEVIESSSVPGEVERRLLSLLRKVNILAVERGIIPDPQFNFVGSISAINLYNTVKTVEEADSPRKVSVISLYDTWSVGPLRVRMEVEPVS